MRTTLANLLALGFALGFALASALASTARAGTNDLAYGGFTRAMRSTSADAVTDSSLDGGGLTYGHDLGLALPPKLTLWVEAGFTVGSADGSMFQTLTTKLTSVSLTAGARARYALHDHVALNARLDLGRAHTSLDLSDPSGNSWSDGAWSNLVAAAVGVDLLAVARPRFSLGIRLELGYVKTASVSLAPHAEHDDGTLKLMTTDASMGHLDLGGPCFVGSLVSQF